jgi:hypothetical protein
MRFHQHGTAWRQINLRIEEHHVLSSLDLSWIPLEKQDAVIDVVGEQLHHTLDLRTGPLVRLTLFDLGAGRPSVMVSVVHHLVIDAVSFGILMEDLEAVYRQLSGGRAVHLPPKTTSLKALAERLAAYASSPELQQELDYWLAEPRKMVVSLPPSAAGSRWSGGQIAWLSQRETRALVYDVPRHYGAEMTDVLLTGLVRACAEWTGSRSLLVDLISHGRDPLFPDLDVSRTVGWLATFFPVLLDLGEARGLAEELQTVKHQLRRVPRRGLGYGVLRYLNPDDEVVSRLRSLPRPQIRLNYTGTSGQVWSDSALFASGPTAAPFLPMTPEGGGRWLRGKRERSPNYS